MANTLGMWKIRVTAKSSKTGFNLAIYETFTVSETTVEHAKAKAQEHMKVKHGSKSVDVFPIVSVEVIKEPGKTDATKPAGTTPASANYTDEEKAWEKVLGTLQTSNDVASTAADLANFKKIASKLGALGLVLNGVDMINDVGKVAELAVKLSKTTDWKARKAILSDMAKLGAKNLKTLVTAAVPVAGYIDLGYSAISSAVKSVNKKITDKKLQEKLMAKKEKYDKESWSKEPKDPNYEAEWKMYAAGVTKDEILTLRNNARIRWS